MIGPLLSGPCSEDEAIHPLAEEMNAGLYLIQSPRVWTQKLEFKR